MAEERAPRHSCPGNVEGGGEKMRQQSQPKHTHTHSAQAKVTWICEGSGVATP